ncbi:MAG TPA: TrmH family RNA methyltransferase [Planctomycetaceae bacterium]|nr:TrmH family RNA methyltransferase [Planctomycetaceae bacterium]
MSGRPDECEQLLEYLAQFLTPRRRQLFDDRVRYRTRHLTVVLEDIYQSHNASACLRSCDCFGVQDVHIIENRYPFSPNRDIVLGAMQWLSVSKYSEQEHNTLQCYSVLRERGYRIVATSPHEADCVLEEYDFRQKTALVFGTELEGISEIARREADEILGIPLFGFTESLNISVAVAVCVHHLTWKLRSSDVPWQLPDEEMLAIKLDWVRRSLGKRREALERQFHEQHGR